MQISINIYYYLKLNKEILKGDKTKLPMNKCLSYTQIPLMMTSSYSGDDSSKNEKSLFHVILENYNYYLELFTQNFIFFHTLGGVRIGISKKQKEIETRFRFTKWSLSFITPLSAKIFWVLVMMTHQKMVILYFVLLWKLLCLELFAQNIRFFHTMGGVRIRISKKQKEL